MAKISCETCNGKGVAVFSCCTGDVIHDDMEMCPVCHEHLGEEDCPDCEGTVQVDETVEFISVAKGLQSKAEDITDSKKE